MQMLGMFLFGWLAGIIATLIILGASLWMSIRQRDDA
jgi:hypothetical protein